MDGVTGAHLVGSAPVETPAQMFALAVDHLGGHLKRIGDGEPGERANWIRWQAPRLGQSPQLRAANPDATYRQLDQFVVDEDAGEVELVNLGYADAARSSYEVFAGLKDEGDIPPQVRFMVGLPSPLSVVTMYVAPGSRQTLLAPYTSAMLEQLTEILTAVPHDQLAIQWEVCIEFGILEGLWTLLDSDDQGEAAKAGIAHHIVALGSAVPDDVELGYHLCYGDAGHQHFTEPSDTTHLAWAAQTLIDEVTRPIQWIHLPVPRDRTDDDYFAPLADLAIPADTELYLGLVHQTGGLNQTQQRIAAARRSVSRFGVATECGLGRRPLDTIPELMDQHAAASSPWS